MTTDHPAPPGGAIDGRLGCSTISFRLLPLPSALSQITGQGFGETGLGALPGICDHVPVPLPTDLVDVLAEQVVASGVAVRVIKVDFAAAIHALTAAGYQGHYSLELETHDIDDADRPAEAGSAGRYISSLLRA